MAEKRLLRALAGEAVWPPPIWLMRQAGRYLPEYRALASEGDFLSRALTPDIATEITLQPVRRYAMDGAILFADILLVPWALGQDLRFVAGHGPFLPPIRDEAALDRLDAGAMVGRLAPVAETVRRLRATLPEGCALIGFAGAPATVACYMVEGGGSRDFTHVRRMAYADPVLFSRLIGLLTAATIAYLSAQIEAGAEAVMLFDSWAGLFPPRLFTAHVEQASARIVAAINDLHPGIPVIGFPRLAGARLDRYAETTGVDAVAVDTGTDIHRAASLLPDRVAIQGNLDPVLLLAGGDPLVAEARAIRDPLRGRAHVFNLGHGILPETPPENVALLVDAVRHG